MINLVLNAIHELRNCIFLMQKITTDNNEDLFDIDFTVTKVEVADTSVVGITAIKCDLI